MIDSLEQLVSEKQNQKDLMIKEIQDLEQKLLQLKNDHYELYGEVESLEHVISLLNEKNEKQKLNALYGKKGK